MKPKKPSRSKSPFLVMGRVSGPFYVGVIVTNDFTIEEYHLLRVMGFLLARIRILGQTEYPPFMLSVYKEWCDQNTVDGIP